MAVAGTTTVSRKRLNLRVEGIFGGSCSHPRAASCYMQSDAIILQTDPLRYTEHTSVFTLKHQDTLKTQTQEVTCRNSTQSFSHRGATHTHKIQRFISHTYQD